ncbi:MAG: WbqC family protein, partial [Proteobacteria bacterium]|nr:WbqC family protein [Pseudomonadota bacterium]
IMILTAHQPVYLPWLGLFHKIAMADAFCYFDDVQYQKKDWNNRNKLKGPNGEFWLTVPVKSKDHYSKKVAKIEINHSTKWQKKHLNSIELNYKSAPCFDRYIGFFRDCYNRKWERLSDLNEYMLKWFLDTLGINVNYFKMSEIGFKGSKNDLVLDMCRKLGADVYIFGQLGRNYADVQKFNNNGIDVYFQEYSHPEYRQLHGPFIPYMSVVDLLFNEGLNSFDIIMNNNVKKHEHAAQT